MAAYIKVEGGDVVKGPLVNHCWYTSLTMNEIKRRGKFKTESSFVKVSATHSDSVL